MKLAQMEVCRRYSAKFMPPNDSDKLGISDSALSGEQPLNGSKHPPESGTSGWFIWGGNELSKDAEFFKPLHVYHIQEHCAAVLPFLPPGGS